MVTISQIGEKVSPQNILMNSFEYGIKASIVGMLEEVARIINESSVESNSPTQKISRVAFKGIEYGGDKTKKAIIAFSFQEVLAQFSSSIGKERLKRLVKSKGFTAALFGAIDQSISYYNYANGEINNRQYKISTFQNIGGTAGGLYGGILGATLLSFIPGIGTLIGGMIGGYLGSKLGYNTGENFYILIEEISE